MCTIAVLFGSHKAHPLCVAANRDEFFARKSEAPVLREAGPTSFIAGRDVQGGGTWLGATIQGFFVGLTNQRSAPTKSPKSRGVLVESLLRRGTVAGALGMLRELRTEEYGEGNLLFGTPEELWVAYCRHGVAVEVQRLAPGIHVLANDRLGSLAFPKTKRFEALLRGIPAAIPWDALALRLETLLGDSTIPEKAPPSTFGPELERRLQALCVKTPNYGTVSSTVLAIGLGGLVDYRYADGSPGEVGFRPIGVEGGAAALPLASE